MPAKTRIRDDSKGFVVSLSGGKDSTAMLHLMLERGEDIKAVLWCDMGDWDWPELRSHIDLVEEKTGIKIERCTLSHSLSYWAFDVIRKDGLRGWGIPSKHKRWCTRKKVEAQDKKRKELGVQDCTICLGFAADETKRVRKPEYRYPLFEYGYTEQMCLDYCYKLGYHWDGLYTWSDRTSCWCCPMRSLRSLRNLRKNRPEKWAELLEWDNKYPAHSKPFCDVGVRVFEERFATEDRKYNTSFIKYAQDYIEHQEHGEGEECSK